MTAAVFKRSSLAVMMAVALAACGGGGGGSSSNNNGGGSGGETPVVSNCNNSTSTSAACDLRMYQIMVESFVNGDDSINYGVGYGPSQHKGDLRGIINSLDYIKKLGVNAIWLTPVFDSCKDKVSDKKLAATGYFACDFFNVDPNFGSNETLKELVDKAHEKGLYVFLDGVFGHVSSLGVTDDSPAGNKPPVRLSGSTTLDYADATNKAINTAFFKEVATHYVTEYGIDGWRLDQAYQVPTAVWTEIRTAVEAAAKARKDKGEKWGTLGYMVAEVWQDQSSIANTAYGKSSAPALLSAFNFPLRYGMVQALGVEESGSAGNASKLYADWNDGAVYPDFAMPNLMLGNHDLVRFGDLLQRGKLAEPTDEAYWLRHKAAFSFMASRSGPITFYYGEEIGDEVPGFAAKVSDSTCASQGLCDDHVARSDAKIEGVTGFVANAAQADLRDNYLTKLLAVRAAHPALYAGARTLLNKDSTQYVELKTAGTEKVLYLLNTGTSAITITVATSKLGTVTELEDLMDGSLLTPSGSSLAIPMPALTGRILLVK
ncbi:MAG: alpha-amylase family glycosyl hydrolase [Aeromonadaceae bacterium]